MSVQNRSILFDSALVVIALSVVVAFLGLHTNSFWNDELFTAYFADPTQSTVREVIARSSQDVHPPGYYLLLWTFLRGLGLDFDPAARVFSAVLACLALPLVYLAPTSSVGRIPRIVAAAFASTSGVWVIYSQEARSYALCFVLVTLTVALALRIAVRLRAGGHVPRTLLFGLTAVSTLACLSHYYAVLVCGAIFTMLLAFSRSLRATASVAFSGAVVLAGVLGLLAWHMPRIYADTNAVWFSTAPAFLAEHISRGVDYILHPFTSQFLVVVLAVVSTGFLLLARRGQRSKIFADPELCVATVLLPATSVLTVIYGVLVSILLTPMLSFRVFVLLAPLLWIAVAYLTHVIILLLPSVTATYRALRFFPMLLAALLLATTKVQINRWVERKQPYRSSAAVVASFPGCRNAAIPVIWWDQPFFAEDDPGRFYGFYLPKNANVHWIKIPMDRVRESLGGAEMGNFLADVAAHGSDCPVMLWSVLPEHWNDAAYVQGVLQERTGRAIERKRIEVSTGLKADIFMLRDQPEARLNH